jgi:hypothetical protein
MARSGPIPSEREDKTRFFIDRSMSVPTGLLPVAVAGFLVGWKLFPKRARPSTPPPLENALPLEPRAEVTPRH